MGSAAASVIVFGYSIAHLAQVKPPRCIITPFPECSRDGVCSGRSEPAGVGHLGTKSAASGGGRTIAGPARVQYLILN
jgi:hypothetical protein